MIRTGETVALGNGIRLHLAETGEAGGRPILFLHGFPEYWAAWEDVLPYFSSGWHAVAPDLRGFNLSSQPTEVAAYRARELVDDFEHLCDRLDWPRVTVVAHDWGGAAAWQWAIAHPQRIERLVVVNSPHPVPFAAISLAIRRSSRLGLHELALRAPGSEQALLKHDCRALENFSLQCVGRIATGTRPSGLALPRGLAPRIDRRRQLLPCFAAVSTDRG
jgi:pimeloyl-ACP methyl ester carboxylesterase